VISVRRNPTTLEVCSGSVVRVSDAHERRRESIQRLSVHPSNGTAAVERDADSH
jgi:hypothetical protein